VTNDAFRARDADRENIAARVAFRGEPDFVAFWIPRQAARAAPRRRSRDLLAIPIDDDGRAAIVSEQWMLDESEAIPVRRRPDLTDPVTRLVQHITDRTFDAMPAADVACHDEVLAVRCPCGLANVLANRARRATADRHARERSRCHIARNVMAAKRQRELAAA
jgi:hypothetical protein